ncbi:serpin family protein, partial [Acidobacteriia bacterium AH_259_A11_L15]|nr:serpin family protein [Acidobacteriia bacterium AH_259_A11_L15]
VVSAYHKFGFKLFAEVGKGEAGQNVFMSPHSVATVLSMLYLGAAGDTRRALGKTLHVEDREPEAISEANRELRKTFSELGPGVELIFANSVWVRTGLEFKSDFLEQVRESFEADIRGLDFSDPAGPDLINQWAATKTKGKISRILDRLDPLMVMVLMNALYFKGQWSEKFDPAESKERPFHLPDGKQKPVPMMSRGGSYRYCEGRGFQAVILPYGVGRFGLYLFLPKKGGGLDAFLQDLNEANWE